MNADRRALAGLLAGAVLIGLAPIFVRLTEVGYSATAFWRCALALPLLAGLALLRGGLRVPPGALALLAVSGLFLAADLVVWHQSIRLTSVANATLLANLAPLFVAAHAVLYLGQRLGAAYWLGLALALTGCALLVSHSLGGVRHSVLGDVCGVLAALFYAGYLIGVSRARQQVGVIAVMFWTTLTMALATLPVSALAGETLWPASARAWAVLAALALLSHAGGQGLIAWAMARLSAAFSSVALLLQPVAAAGFAWLLLGEPLGLVQGLGAVVVLAGILLCRSPGALSRPP
ncbi:MAG TPA: DMT family transporter [Nevskiaceae bacterium]|nr:DMT family transporter [Nevskiaceae bacterium]